MNYPNLCLVDTNVAKTANLAIQPNPDSDVTDECVKECINAIEHITKKKGLVIDAGDEIYDEYRQQLSMSGQPGMGDAFMKWVHDHRYNPEYCSRVAITKNGDSYNEFPVHDNLKDFDLSDRKFVAVSNTHSDKPPILQATDSKWWGWNDALQECDIVVQFVCSEYIEKKYHEKMEK